MSFDDDTSRLVGSTIVSLIALPGHCVAAWAGDSRVYRLRHGQLAQITRDHSQVEDLIENGSLSRAQAESHPEANVITRAVGGHPDIVVDMTIVSIEDDDRFLLCSDGLYKDLAESEIGRFLATGNSKQACEELVAEAKKRECNDNVTVIVVDFEGRSENNSVEEH
jgi:serine/threonine protein phosphatase PrpC